MSLPATMRIRIAPIDQGGLTSEGMSVCGTPGAAEPTDEMLMTRIQQDGQEALGCLFLRYARVVRSIASRILRDAAEVEDLVQDLFLFIQRKSRIFDSSKSSLAGFQQSRGRGSDLTPRSPCDNAARIATSPTHRGSALEVGEKCRACEPVPEATAAAVRESASRT